MRRITGSSISFAALGIAASAWVAFNSNVLGDQYGFDREQLSARRLRVTLLLVVLGNGPACDRLAAAARWRHSRCSYGLFGQFIPGGVRASGTAC